MRFSPLLILCSVLVMLVCLSDARIKDRGALTKLKRGSTFKGVMRDYPRERVSLHRCAYRCLNLIGCIGLDHEEDSLSCSLAVSSGDNRNETETTFWASSSNTLFALTNATVREKVICPPLWSNYFGDRCYRVNDELYTWSELTSSNRCRDLNPEAQLSEMHNVKEFNYVTSKLTQSVWVSAGDITGDDIYRWLPSGVNVSDVMMEPDYSHDNDNCLYVSHTTGKLSPAGCSGETLPALCEF